MQYSHGYSLDKRTKGQQPFAHFLWCDISSFSIFWNDFSMATLESYTHQKKLVINYNKYWIPLKTNTFFPKGNVKDFRFALNIFWKI